MIYFIQEIERPKDEQILEWMYEKEAHPDFVPIVRIMLRYPGIESFYSKLTSKTRWWEG